jgi:hypothetical protein
MTDGERLVAYGKQLRLLLSEVDRIQTGVNDVVFSANIVADSSKDFARTIFNDLSNAIWALHHAISHIRLETQHVDSPNYVEIGRR